jgi:prepilin-type processing-associated H-X9-DG protein
VELLVVIGIIALLISILLPALSKARKSANTTKCLAQHKQLMAAFLLYANEWKGAIPWPGYDGGTQGNGPTYPGWLYDINNRVAAGKWDTEDVKRGSLYPYLNTTKVFRCPDDQGPWSTADIQYLSTYIMNGTLAADQNYKPASPPTPRNLFKITAFKPDTAVFWEIGSGPSLPAGQKNDSSNRPEEGITVRHSKGTTISFIDGHAEVWSLDTYVTDMNMAGPPNGGSRLWRNPLNANGSYGGPYTFGPIGSGKQMIYSE